VVQVVVLLCALSHPACSPDDPDLIVRFKVPSGVICATAVAPSVPMVYPDYRVVKIECPRV
jgi:hypothetical protein